MIQQLITIGRNTFIECIRQPIYVVLILVAILLLVLNVSWSAYTMADDNKFLLPNGLGGLLLAGLFLSAFSATGVLAAEIESRTVLTVVSKPVYRPIFVLGKFVGVAAAISLAYWILSLVFLLGVRHRVLQTVSENFDGPVLAFGVGGAMVALAIAAIGNYLYRWAFTSTFIGWLAALLTLAFGLVLVISKDWRFQSPVTEFLESGSLGGGQLILALVMVFESVLMLVAVAIAASTRLGQMMTLVICATMAALGVMTASAFTGARRLVYVVLPNFQHFWPGDALTVGNAIPVSYVALVSVYGLCYIAAALFLAVALFQTREVG